MTETANGILIGFAISCIISFALGWILSKASRKIQPPAEIQKDWFDPQKFPDVGPILLTREQWGAQVEAERLLSEQKAEAARRAALVDKAKSQPRVKGKFVSFTHPFNAGGGSGTPDRPCVTCGLPDRHPYHKNNIDVLALEDDGA